MDSFLADLLTGAGILALLGFITGAFFGLLWLFWNGIGRLLGLDNILDRKKILFILLAILLVLSWLIGHFSNL